MADSEMIDLRVRLARRVARHLFLLGASPVVVTCVQLSKGTSTEQLGAASVVVLLVLVAVCAFGRLSPRMQSGLLLGALLQVPVLSSLLFGFTPGLAAGSAIVWVLAAFLVGSRLALAIGAFLVSWILAVGGIDAVFPGLLRSSDGFLDIRDWQNWARTSLTLAALTAVAIPALVGHLRALRDATRASLELLERARIEERRRSEANAARVRAEGERREAAGLGLLDFMGAGIVLRCGDLVRAIGAEVDWLRARSVGAAPSMRGAVDDLTDSVAAAGAVLRRLFPAEPETGPAPSIDLGELVTSARRQLGKFRGVDVVAHVEPVRGARIDPCLMHGILLNLVLNARDAMPQGGTLTLTARPATPAEEEGTGCACALDVADTGSGMDQATLGHLFEPFFTTKGAAGTGVGLHATRHALEQVGGHVRVVSAPGQGTTFTILLPAAPSLPSATRGEASGAIGGGGQGVPSPIAPDEDAVRKGSTRTGGPAEAP
jgi:signal transduction histidine kinase